MILESVFHDEYGRDMEFFKGEDGSLILQITEGVEVAKIELSRDQISCLVSDLASFAITTPCGS